MGSGFIGPHDGRQMFSLVDLGLTGRIGAFSINRSAYGEMGLMQAHLFKTRHIEFGFLT